MHLNFFFTMEINNFLCARARFMAKKSFLRDANSAEYNPYRLVLARAASWRLPWLSESWQRNSSLASHCSL